MVTIQEYTYKNPIQMIGTEAGVCYESDITDSEKNYKRGIDCLEAEHGRTWEFPEVYMILDSYSARVIREFYTHIAGAPSRLQSSTRYINYEEGFDYFIPPKIQNNPKALDYYKDAIGDIHYALERLEKLGIPKEDSANLLPLGMNTKVVVKINLRTLIAMSHQRLCMRAYHEYRKLMDDIMNALIAYSEEWKYLVDNYFMPKCEYLGHCPEKKSCGRKEHR